MAKGSSQSGSQRPKRIVFFHPDLGIGGAERLIIDAAVGLQDLGHKVTIFTSHRDPQHSFDEARDGTLDVRVRGNTLFPPTILNRLRILLATLRQIHLVLRIAFFSDELHALGPDVFIVDQLSACVPLLRWLYPRRQRTLFYCHFPDQLLADRNQGGSLGYIKRLYRIPFDWFEGWSMSASDRIVVNSNFTKTIAGRVFPKLTGSFGVIYPCVNMPDGKSATHFGADQAIWDNKFKIILSINRFERKKDIELAIRAYIELTKTERKGTRLVLAGGYDNRVIENVEYHKELVTLADEAGLVSATAKTVSTALGIPDSVDVLFLLSVPGSFKNRLLDEASLMLYTPTNEHFGIVPVEAMQHGLPVLAANTGGPLETIAEGETGWLRDVNKAEEWTDVMRMVLHQMDSARLAKIGEAGKIRVRRRFTRDTMAKKFDDEIAAMREKARSPFWGGTALLMLLGSLAVVLAATLAFVLRARTATGPDMRFTRFATAERRNIASDSSQQFFAGQRP